MYKHRVVLSALKYIFSRAHRSFDASLVHITATISLLTESGVYYVYVVIIDIHRKSIFFFDNYYGQCNANESTHL